MKKIFLMFAFTLLLITVFISCKKEDDERDKFVGTWTGHLYFSRIGTEYSMTLTIAKSRTNTEQILIGENIATINGNSYIYEKFTSGLGIAGNYTGSGTIKGDELTESGFITSNGSPFEGDLGQWYRHLIKE